MHAAVRTNTTIPSGISKTIAEFKFTAATNNNTLNGRNKVVVADVIFNLNASNVELNSESFKFYNVADPSTKHPCIVRNRFGTVITAPGLGVFGPSLFIECANMNNGNVDSTLDSGESSTFVIEGSVTQPAMISAEPSTLQVSLQNFNDINLNSTFGFDKSHFQWFDKDTDASAYQWIEYPETRINGTLYQQN